MDVTQIIQSANEGDAGARADLIRVMHDELRRLAYAKMKNERMDHTLTATALVNEVSIRMLNESNVPAENRGQFIGFASRAMRNLLIDHARKRGSQKRGGDRQKFAFEEAVIASDQQSEDFLALHEALEHLAEFDSRKAKVVELKYFGGMTNDQVAESLDISKATVKRDWELARGWLLKSLTERSS